MIGPVYIPVVELRTRVCDVSCMNTKAGKQNSAVYAAAFHFLNTPDWLDRHAAPSNLGAGIVLIGAKPDVAQSFPRAADVTLKEKT